MNIKHLELLRNLVKDDNNGFLTNFLFLFRDGEKLTIIPTSKTVLFYEHSLVVTVQGGQYEELTDYFMLIHLFTI